MAKNSGVVVETGDGWAIILGPGGEYKKVRTREPLLVGDLYHRQLPYPRYIAAAVIILLLLISGLDFFAVKAYARVSTGVEFGVNRWERIVSVRTTSDQGEEILEGVKIKGQKINSVLPLVVKNAMQKDWFENNNQIEISVQSTNKKSEKIEKDLAKTINKTIRKEFSENKYPKKTHIEQQGSKLTVEHPAAGLKENEKGNKEENSKDNKSAKREQPQNNVNQNIKEENVKKPEQSASPEVKKENTHPSQHQNISIPGRQSSKPDQSRNNKGAKGSPSE